MNRRVSIWTDLTIWFNDRERWSRIRADIGARSIADPWLAPSWAEASLVWTRHWQTMIGEGPIWLGVKLDELVKLKLEAKLVRE